MYFYLQKSVSRSILLNLYNLHVNITKYNGRFRETTPAERLLRGLDLTNKSLYGLEHNERR